MVLEACVHSSASCWMHPLRISLANISRVGLGFRKYIVLVSDSLCFTRAPFYSLVFANSSASLASCITTATTAGFGDFAPPTPFARLLAVFFIPVAVLFMTEWLTMTANTMIAQRQAAFRKSYETKELTMLDIEIMDTNGDGKIDRAEYLEFMVLAMAKVDQPLLDDLRTQFNRLDVAKTGYLDRDNMKAMAKKKLRSARRKLELAAYKKRLLEVTPTMQSHR
jgi:Ion channel